MLRHSPKRLDVGEHTIYKLIDFAGGHQVRTDPYASVFLIELGKLRDNKWKCGKGTGRCVRRNHKRHEQWHGYVPVKV